MEGFPASTDSTYDHDEYVEGNDEDTTLLGLDGDDRSQLLSTKEEVIGACPYSSRGDGAESDLSSTRTTSAWSSSAIQPPPEPTASFSSATPSGRSDCESHVGFNADVGSGAGVANVVGRNDTGAVAQARKKLPAMSAGSSERDGVKGGASDDDGLAAEDWLDVLDALDAGTEPESRLSRTRVQACYHTNHTNPSAPSKR